MNSEVESQPLLFWPAALVLMLNYRRDMLHVCFYFNTAGGHCCDVACLPAELCTPKCLVVAAATAGAIFATCPSKYGCRQFVNPAFEKGGKNENYS